MRSRPKMCTSLRLKVFGVDNKSHKLRVLQPKTRGTYWDSKGVDAILHEVAEDLERRFPAYKYKLVPIGPYAFNFVFVGTREVPTEGVEDGAPEVGVQSGE